MNAPTLYGVLLTEFAEWEEELPHLVNDLGKPALYLDKSLAQERLDNLREMWPHVTYELVRYEQVPS
jgi:hypothetical protein